MDVSVKVENNKTERKRMLGQDQDSIRMDGTEFRVDRVHKVFYRLIRNVIIFIIGFGAPLNQWLKPNDIFRVLLERHNKLWFYYKIYCWLLIHICLVLNVSSLVYLCVWINKDVSELCQQIVQLIWSLSAAVALDCSYYYRNSTLLETTCKKTTEVLKDCPKLDNLLVDQYMIFKIKIPLHLNFIKHFYKIYSIPKLHEFIKLFLFPIIFNLYFYLELLINWNTLSVEKVLNLFMFMNIFIVTVNILIYLAFCLVFRNKFRLLNQFLDSLIETKNTSIDNLYIIAKWYKHNYSKVIKFDNTFNLFIVTFYLSIALNIIVSIFGIILHTNIETNIFKNILVYNIFYYTFIACNTLLFCIFSYIAFKAASDVNVVSNKTKTLIEKYVTCSRYEQRSIDFNIEYQHFNTTVFSKPVNLTLFGFGSITKVSLGFGLISMLPYIPDIIEFSLEHKFPIDQKDLTQYWKEFVNETMESLEEND